MCVCGGVRVCVCSCNRFSRSLSLSRSFAVFSLARPFFSTCCHCSPFFSLPYSLRLGPCLPSLHSLWPFLCPFSVLSFFFMFSYFLLFCLLLSLFFPFPLPRLPFHSPLPLLHFFLCFRTSRDRRKARRAAGILIRFDRPFSN